MDYYITNSNDLAAEIKKREESANGIKLMIDMFADREYGIEKFSGIIENFFGLDRKKRYGILCRQVATIRVEEVCFYLACRKFMLDPVNFVFPGDAFSTRNSDKVHLIKVPWIAAHSEKGDPIIINVKYADFSKFEGLLLGNITLKESELTLPEFHQRMREQVFSQECPPSRDIGELFKLYMAQASKKPAYVFQTEGKRSVKKPAETADLSNSRPPAEWYYILYLLNFMAGNMVLFETYENDRGDVPEIKKHFSRAMDAIREEVGLYPLVIKIPALTNEMMYCNISLFDPDWINRINIPDDDREIVPLFEELARQVIGLQ